KPNPEKAPPSTSLSPPSDLGCYRSILILAKQAPSSFWKMVPITLHIN
ncbi:MAG: hypothetical protein ACI9UO_002627, partial [Nitrospinales bacterium]